MHKCNITADNLFNCISQFSIISILHEIITLKCIQKGSEWLATINFAGIMPSSCTLKIINVNFIKHLFFDILCKNTITFSTVLFYLSMYKIKCFLCLFSFVLSNSLMMQTSFYLLKTITYKAETHKRNQRFMNKSNASL